MCAVVVGGAYLFDSDWATSPRLVDRRTGLLLAIAPWAVVLFGSIAFFARLSRHHLRRQWNTKPYLQRRRTIVLDGVGEQSTDEMTTMIYRWPYFGARSRRRMCWCCWTRTTRGTCCPSA
jgi:hypothetical protein